jgi:catechol 2,3-dioxygenase-like lactoylglutathione lyase family enzyme
VGGADPTFDGVLETCLYHGTDARQEMFAFYADLLGLPEVARWDDGVAFRAGPGVILLFDRDRLADREGPIAEHGSSGPGHACLFTDRHRYERWKQRLTDRGVEITHEHEWSGERRSMYFHDPAGNLLEIADGDLWPGIPPEG